MRRFAALLTAVAAVAGCLAAAEPAAVAAARPSWPHQVVGGFPTPSGAGYWVVYANGGVAARGDATRMSDASTRVLTSPLVGGAATPTGRGYWLVTRSGTVFGFGDAHVYGSLRSAASTNPRVLSMSSTHSGKGYWLVAGNGGVFTFGDARFHGSTAGLSLTAPIVGITRTLTGRGYRLVGRDGGVFSFGKAPYFGSLPSHGIRVDNVVGAAATPGNKGYWIARSDGRVSAFGHAHALGSFAAAACNPVTAIIGNPRAHGYRLVTRSGASVPFGHAPGGQHRVGAPGRCTAPPPPKPRPRRPTTSFVDGSYLVRTDIRPDTYRTRANVAGCYWERERGLSGDPADVLSSDFTNVSVVVTIRASDKGFRSSGCGTWTTDLSRITKSKTAPFRGGTYLVGTDISPGRWRNSGGAGCYWERERGFSGTHQAVIANDFTNSRVTVTIARSDRGFMATEDCGRWTRVN